MFARRLITHKKAIQPQPVTAITAALLALTALTGQAQMTMPEAARVQKITDGLHVVMGVGGNIAVSSGADGVLMVDDDMPPVAGKIAAAIATITDQPVDMVFNTHWHFDHTGGNRYFGEQGALIIAHDNVRARMAVDQKSLLTNSVTKASPKVALPVVTFDNEISFHMNGQTIVAKHVKRPAHTDGDAILYFKEANVIHMGDNFFNRLYPVVDISAGGTADGMIAAMDTVIAEANADTVIIPGHGPVSDLDGLKAFRAMLDTVNQRIRSLVAQGKTADEVVALKPTTDYDAEWAWEFMPAERWTRLMYDSAVSAIAIENKQKQ